MVPVGGTHFLLASSGRACNPTASDRFFTGQHPSDGLKWVSSPPPPHLGPPSFWATVQPHTRRVATRNKPAHPAGATIVVAADNFQPSLVTPTLRILGLITATPGFLPAVVDSGAPVTVTLTVNATANSSGGETLRLPAAAVTGALLWSTPSVNQPGAPFQYGVAADGGQQWAHSEMWRNSMSCIDKTKHLLWLSVQTFI